MTKKIKKKVQLPDITIIRDTREQQGFQFNGYSVMEQKLDTGDYSISGMENIITIERKQVYELYGNFGKGRERFLKELERMKQIPYKFLIIEGNLDTFLEGNKFSRLSQGCLIGSLISLIFKNNIHVIFAGTKELAEKMALKILIKCKTYLDRGDIL